MRHKHFFRFDGASASSFLQHAASAKSRVCSSNVVTAAVMSLPDTYRALNGKIVGKEYGIRMAERGAGIVGSSAGTYVGVAVGTCICPGVGSVVGGFIGNMLGGIGGNKAAFKCLR